MSDPNYPRHYMRGVKSEEDIRGLLDSDFKKAAHEYQQHFGEKGARTTNGQMRNIKESFSKMYESNGLESVVEKNLKEHYGDGEIDEYLLETLYHVPEKIGMKASRHIARDVALHIAEIVGGPQLKESYSKAESEVLDRFVAGELQAIASQLKVPIESVEDLAKLIYGERSSIKGALSGTLEPEELKDSQLGKLMGAYRTQINSHNRSARNWQKVMPEYVKDNYAQAVGVVNEHLGKLPKPLELAPNLEPDRVASYLVEVSRPGWQPPELDHELEKLGLRLKKSDD